MKIPNLTKGITLVEALVSIAIVLIATTGPLSRIQDSLINTQYARDQMIATYLAQEGIEITRAIRDSNWIEEDPSFTFVDECLSPQVCTVTATSPLDEALQVCEPGGGDEIIACEPLRYIQSTGTYGYHPSGEVTHFTRSLTVEPVGNNLDEREVIVSVVWETRPGKGRTIEVREHLFDFQRGSGGISD